MNVNISHLAIVFSVAYMFSGCTNTYYLSEANDFSVAAASVKSVIDERQKEYAEADREYLLSVASEDRNCPVSSQYIYVKTLPIDLKKIISAAKTENKNECKAAFSAKNTLVDSSYRCFTQDEANCFNITKSVLLAGAEQKKIDSRISELLDGIRIEVEPGYFGSRGEPPASAAIEALGAYAKILNDLSTPYDSNSYSNFTDGIEKLEKLKEKFDKVKNDFGFSAVTDEEKKEDEDQIKSLSAGSNAVDQLIGSIKKWKSDSEKLEEIRLHIRNSGGEAEKWIDAIIEASISGQKRYLIALQVRESGQALDIADEFSKSDSASHRLDLLKKRIALNKPVADKNSVRSVAEKLREMHRHLIAIMDGNLSDQDKIKRRKVAFDNFKEALSVLKNVIGTFG